MRITASNACTLKAKQCGTSKHVDHASTLYQIMNQTGHLDLAYGDALQTSHLPQVDPFRAPSPNPILQGVGMAPLTSEMTIPCINKLQSDRLPMRALIGRCPYFCRINLHAEALGEVAAWILVLKPVWPPQPHRGVTPATNTSSDRRIGSLAWQKVSCIP